MVLQRDQVRFSKNTLMANRCFSNDNYRQCECALSMSYRVLLKVFWKVVFDDACNVTEISCETVEIKAYISIIKILAIRLWDLYQKEFCPIDGCLKQSIQADACYSSPKGLVHTTDLEKTFNKIMKSKMQIHVENCSV